jgi:integrase
MVEILPSDVREWVRHLSESGMSPATIRHNRIILSAIFTTALNDQVTLLHPCKGVKTPTVPAKPKRIITPEQFETIYYAVPDPDSRLLIELDIESGLRWGELTELRVRDLDMDTGIVTVSRVVVQLNSKFHPTGGRFLVKEYPKDKESRRFMLSSQIVAKLRAHIESYGLGPDDLIFELHRGERRTSSLAVVRDLDGLGLTEPNAKGRQYKHGSLSGYSAGRCRCAHCKGAYAEYRAARRAAGKDAPRAPRLVDTDGHFPRDWFRVQVWLPALKKAGLGVHVRVHDLRHAHASWLQMRGVATDATRCGFRNSDAVGVPGFPGLVTAA